MATFEPGETAPRAGSESPSPTNQSLLEPRPAKAGVLAFPDGVVGVLRRFVSFSSQPRAWCADVVFGHDDLAEEGLVERAPHPRTCGEVGLMTTLEPRTWGCQTMWAYSWKRLKRCL